jgi:hypothetical protein
MRQFSNAAPVPAKEWESQKLNFDVVIYDFFLEAMY